MFYTSPQLILFVNPGQWTAFIWCFWSFLTTRSTFTTQVIIHPFTHTHSHTLRAGGFSTKSHPAHQELIHTVTHQWSSHREQFGVQYLTQGDLTCRGAGDRITDLLIGRQPTLPTEPHPPHSGQTLSDIVFVLQLHLHSAVESGFILCSVL